MKRHGILDRRGEFAATADHSGKQSNEHSGMLGVRLDNPAVRDPLKENSDQQSGALEGRRGEPAATVRLGEKSGQRLGSNFVRIAAWLGLVMFCCGRVEAQTQTSVSVTVDPSAVTSTLSSLWQQAQTYGRSRISWKDAQSPFTPGAGAIIGGPGNAPEPGAPMFVCRAQVESSLVPGKWVKGNCNVAYGGKEVVMRQYQVAYGDAVWQPYSGSVYGLVRTGTDSDGTPLFSCRAHYNPGFPQGDQGNQPGKLAKGACRIPYGGGELVIGPPFEALYGGGGGGYPPYPYPPYSPYPPNPPMPTQVYPMPGASTVTWRAAKEGDTPGPGAIEGGPGNGPEPGSPLYVCRAGVYAGGLFPGKWIQGKCSVAFDKREFKQSKYDVAYGSAVWGPFGGVITPEMVQGGYDVDQTPLYICRVTHYKIAFQADKGNQPGYLKNGQCWIPYSNGSPNDPPFEVLYNAPAGGADAGQVGNGGAAGPAGMIVSFDSGTGATPGTLVVTNGATGKTVSRQLDTNLTAEQCLQVLQQAALDAGSQIQSDAQGLKLAGANNSVHVTGANVTMTPY